MRVVFPQTGITSNTYALETWTSCQLLERFCFSPSRGVKPSFLFSSPQCLSFAARTCRRVPISSSTFGRGLSLNHRETPTRVTVLAI